MLLVFSLSFLKLKLRNAFKFHLGLVVCYVFPKASYPKSISLMTKFLIHGWEEWNSNGMGLRVRIE
jgi:hypothetical protein